MLPDRKLLALGGHLVPGCSLTVEGSGTVRERQREIEMGVPPPPHLTPTTCSRGNFNISSHASDFLVYDFLQTPAFIIHCS
jgi:hypothetical protein